MFGKTEYFSYIRHIKSQTKGGDLHQLVMEIVIKMNKQKGILLKKCIKEYLDNLAKTQGLMSSELEELLEILSEKLNK